jgi:hypothetical protein
MGNELKALGEDTVQFYDAEAKVSLNHVPLGAQTIVPREGELVLLPADMTGSEAGYYQVKRVEYYYQRDSATEIPEDIGPVKLGRITVQVTKVRSARAAARRR